MKNLLLLLIFAGAAQANDLSQIGQNIYTRGVGADKKELVSTDGRKGQQVACIGCHLKSGLGALEGTIVTLPITGVKLFSPYSGFPEIGREGGMAERVQTKNTTRFLMHRYHGSPFRPAYTEKLFGRAMTQGKDAAGRKLEVVMPRLKLTKLEQAGLLTYLKGLSSSQAAGVDNEVMHLGTVIAGDISPAIENEALMGLQQFIMLHNSQGPRTIANFRKIQLSVWRLTGEESTWPAQLEKYNTAQPVFALVGGISKGSWKNIHKFSEDNKIPTLFPITNEPVVSKDTAYTFYWTKGYYQEGETAAKFIKSKFADAKTAAIITDSSTSQSFKKGFLDTWKGNIIEADINDQQLLSKISKAEAVVAWTGSTDKLKDIKVPVILSASILEENLLKIPAEIKQNAFITYPYWLPQAADATFKFRKPRYGEVPGVETPRAITTEHVAYKINTLTHILGDIITQLRGNFYTDYLVDRVGLVEVGGAMGIADDSPYEHIGFGVGQHYAAKGCNVVQIVNDKVVAASSWIIQ